jgi:hypothetical protein
VVSANDAWAVGAAGRRPLIEHWDGTSWSQAAAQPGGGYLYGIAARSSSDVWAVGWTNTEQTLVKHWNGLRWSTVSSPNAGTYDGLYAVCIISRNDAWAVGYSVPYNYILMHWDGISWSLVKGPPVNESGLFSLKAFATNDVWAVGWKDSGVQAFTLHYDGTAWTEVPGSGSLLAVDGAAPKDVWAMGNLAIHWDGSVWTFVTTPVAEYYGLTVLSSSNVIAVGVSGGAPFSAHWDGNQWQAVTVPPVLGGTGWLNAVSGHGGSIWAVGQQGFGAGEPDDLILKWTP